MLQPCRSPPWAPRRRSPLQQLALPARRRVTPTLRSREIKFSSGGASGQSTYTTGTSSSQLTGLTATYAVNGKVSDSAGLVTGNSTMTTVATCSQGI